jgi:uncharacterized repeat protein (TIGR01451 family)
MLTPSPHGLEPTPPGTPGFPTAPADARGAFALPSARIALVAALVLTVLGLALAPGRAAAAPGVPAAPRTVYTEDFENATGAAPVALNAYTGASGQAYTADAPWLTGCNGVVLRFSAPDSAQAAAGCGQPSSYSAVRQTAYALGGNETNHSVSAYTENNPGADAIQFETTTPIALSTSNRFITFSVDAAETSCTSSHALFKFYLLNGGTEIPTFTTPIDPCADPGTRRVTAPAVGTVQQTAFQTGTFAGNRAVLFSGAALGIRMRNGQGSGAGNDAGFDNIRVLDATPQLDKSFSVTDLNAGGTSRLTFTITNTTELGAKEGWSFTDTLSTGLSVADPASATTTCTNGVVTAAAGSGSIAVTGDLDQGQESCTVSVDVTSPTAGTYTNGPDNLSLIGLDPPPPTDITFRAADLSIVKSAIPAIAVAGKDQTYQLVVTNNGPDTARNVRVADALPAGLTYVSASPECSAVDATVACTVPSIDAGETRTFTVTANVSASAIGTLTNTATVGSDTTDPDPDDNTSTITVPIEDRADLSIVKSATPTTATPGKNQTYELVVKNDGPNTAQNVRVADALPTGLTFVSASPECSLAGATVACTVPSLASGETRTFTVTTKVAASINGRLTNTATVASDTPDPDPSDNTSTVVVPTEGKADLSITKTPSVETVGPNGQVLYTLVVKNDGPSDATGVTVTDTPPAGLTLQSAKGGTGTTCAVTDNRVACQVGRLAADGTAQVLVTAQASAAASGDLTNRATVTGNEEDPDPKDNTDTSTVTVTPPPGTPQGQPAAELAIVKKVNTRSIRLGQSLTYTVVVSNNGPAAASDVVVTDTLAVPARNVSIKPSAGKCTGTVPFTCRLGTIQPGKKVTITVKLTPTKVGTARNTASVTSPGTDPKTDNNISGVSTAVSKPTLGLSKVADHKTVRAGQTITYTLRVKNPSSAPVKNVQVCDDLPSGLVYVGSKSRAKLTKGQYCWTVKSLGAGKSATFTLTARALRGTSGTKTNRATASAPDARTGRASRSVRVTRTALRAGGVTG